MTESKLRRYLKRRANSGNWFIFYRAYMKLMPRITSIFLQDLMNLACSPKAITEEIDGKEYFLCTIKFLENSESEWSEEEQSKQLEILQGKETKRNPDPKRNGTGNAYIHICRKGAGAPRWIYIDYEKLEEDLDVFGFGNTPKTDPDDSDKEGRPGNTPESDPGIPPNQTREYPRHNKKKKEEKEIPRNSPTANPGGSGGASFCREESIKKTKARILADKLHEGLLRKNKLVAKYNPKKWESRFAELLRHKSFDEIRHYLKDHLENLSDKFQPKLYSAESFCREFQRVIDAAERRDSPAFENIEDSFAESRPQARFERLPNGRLRAIINPADWEDIG